MNLVKDKGDVLWRVAMNRHNYDCSCGVLPSDICCTECQHVYVGKTDVREYDDITIGYYSSYELACEAAEAVIRINPNTEEL